MMRREMLFAALFAALLAVGAQRVVAQEPVPLLAGDSDASAQLAKIIETTHQKGLPTDPILTKVRYYLVYHAAPARIVAAARAMAARLEVAREALAPRATERDIMAGEGALGSPGVTSAELRAVRAASANTDVVVPLGVLAQLVESGVDVKRAAAMVTDLIKRGASPTQLATLGNDVDSDVLRGARATNALDIRTRGLNAVLAPPGVSATSDASLAAQSGSGKGKP